MGFNEFISKLFGNKASRDMKEIKPWVDKVKAVYPEIAKLSHDELRAKTEELKKYIHDSAIDEHKKIEELKASIESTELEDREALFAQIDKLEKEVLDKYEKALDDVLPQAFAIVKDTARRFSENPELEVTATDFDRELAALEPQSKKMFFTVGKVSGKITLEAQLGNCLAHNFVLTDNYGTLNKITFINKDNENEKAIYYLHPSGAIDRKDENRITPVFFSAEYIQGAEDFLKEAYSRAYEQMTPEKYQQCIELSFREDDRMVSPNQIHIGQLAEIWYQDKRYTSVMTGYSRGKGVITLVFGCIRLELTKKLILSRRQEG